MIKELGWDTEFFGRKIGTFKKPPSSRKRLVQALEDAGKEGFQYLSCRLDVTDIKGIRMLEAADFYLSDIGVTWETSTDRDVRGTADVSVAAEKDIRAVKKMTEGLFEYSRFYHDPFFKKGEADRLFKAWVENSVKRRSADIVLRMKGTGFITCRRVSASMGEISLVGVVYDKRGKGSGKALVSAALRWFREEKIKRARVRTQLMNIQGMNFYSRMGFRVTGVDVVMSKVLKQAKR